jgi:hypothetical protein
MCKIRILLLLFIIIIISSGFSHAEEKQLSREVSEKLLVKPQSMIKDSITISPDNRHVAYLAVEKKFLSGVKWFVVLDGKELKKYDSIGINSLIFSPDSTHLAYMVFQDKKQFVVVDEAEGKQYYGIFMVGGANTAKFIFYSSDSLHYLTADVNGIYLVEEQIK